MSFASTEISAHDKQVKNLGVPTDDNDAATKSFFDSKIKLTDDTLQQQNPMLMIK